MKIVKAVLMIALAALLWGCGERATAPESSQVIAPRVAETQNDYILELSCPWMLTTFYAGHPWDMDIAITSLQSEMANLLHVDDPQAIPQEIILQEIVGCHWREQVSPEAEAQSQAEFEQWQNEQDEKFKKLLEDWKAQR